MTAVPAVVVDTSVAVKWFFDEPYSREALHLLEAFEQGRLRPLAPDLIYAEFANAVWKRVSAAHVRPEDGEAVIAAFLDLPLEVVPSPLVLLPAYRLALEHRQSIYDALFLALSLQAGADLVTADRAFYESISAGFPQVRWVGDGVRGGA
ncbi:MAG: type II toxin-antitoxin system VapC family toxin [bacterium]|nr:type II toxin-antitoxin system VapC family toxin [bacterium]